MTLQIGDICVANSASLKDSLGNVIPLSNKTRVEVFRSDSLVETWESGWIGSISSNLSSYRNVFDQQGSFYCSNGASSSAGSRVWKFDIDGNFIGPEETAVSTEPSPWGVDIGDVCVGECPPGPGFFASGPVFNIIGMFNDVDNNVWTLRQGASIDDLGTTTQVLARYDITGNPLEKYEVCFDWARSSGAGTSERLLKDVQCAGLTCDGTRLIVASLNPFASPDENLNEPFTITAFDLINASSVSQVFYQESGIFIRSLQVNPRNGNVVCLISDILGTITPRIRVFSSDGVILDTFELNITGIPQAIDFDTDFRYLILGVNNQQQPFFSGQSSFYRVNLNSHSVEGLLFSSNQSIGNSFAVFKGTTPCNQLGAVGVFGTVIGAT